MTRSSQRHCLGLLIAGGESQRMGSDKAKLLLPNGKSLREAAWSMLQALCTLAVSVGKTSAFDIADAMRDAGPLAGVLAGLEHAKARGFREVLVLPVDLPLLKLSSLSALLDAPAASATWLRAGEAEAPLAARLDITIAPKLRSFLLEDGRSVFEFFRSVEADTYDLGAAAAPQLRNANTPEEWQEMLALWPQMTQEAKGC